MTLAELNETLNRNIPIVSSEQIDKISTLIAQFKSKSSIAINYTFLEQEILNRTKRAHHRSSIKAFFSRLRNGDAFENLINKKEFAGDGSKKRKNSLKASASKKKFSSKESTQIGSQSKPYKSQDSAPPKRASWNKERIVIGIYEPGVSHSETEEDPVHRK